MKKLPLSFIPIAGGKPGGNQCLKVYFLSVWSLELAELTDGYGWKRSLILPSPGQGTSHRPVPALDERIPFCFGDGGEKLALTAPVGADFVQILPVASGQTCQIGRAKGGSFNTLRPLQTDVGQVGLKLHQKIVCTSPAIYL